MEQLGCAEKGNNVSGKGRDRTGWRVAALSGSLSAHRKRRYRERGGLTSAEVDDTRELCRVKDVQRR